MGSCCAKVKERELSKSIGGYTQVSCNPIVGCYPEGIVINKNLPPLKKEYVLAHEYYHWEDISKYPFLIYGLMRDFGPLWEDIYEGITEYQTINKLAEGDLKKALKLYMESPYRMQVYFVANLFEDKDIEKVKEYYDRVGREFVQEYIGSFYKNTN